MASARDALSALTARLRQRQGPLTAELRRAAGPGALGQVPVRLQPDAVARTVCGYCSTGCGLEAHLRDGAAVNLSPSVAYPVNRGHACPKGWEALSALDPATRALSPLVRERGGALRKATWPDALRRFVGGFRSVAERHGPEAMAFLGTGQITTEELVFLGALAKFGMGMVHGDGNTRQCMATAVTAYKECFGFDAPPYSYADLESSDVIVLVGSNLCIAHPILWSRICANPHQPSVWVVDPRRTETAQAATRHLPIRARSDLSLFLSVAQVLIERGWVDRGYVEAHTEGYEAFAAHVRPFTPERVSGEIGLPARAVVELAEAIHRGRRVSFWWTMGVNQGHQAVRTAQALIALALLTGNIGRPGTGANSITGQCNAMGSRLFSNTTCLFGGREFADAGHRLRVAEVLQIPEARIPSGPSLAYDGILEAIREGRIRALWIVATNTVHSWIQRDDVVEVLRRLDFLGVQDLYDDTETAALADVFLPAAGWGEKQGTFINSERRVGLVQKLRRAPGEALADFHIFQLVAEAWGCGDLFARWKTPEDVFGSVRELSRGQPCDLSGITGYEMLEAEGGVQWPLAEGEPLRASERRLFEDGCYYHPGGRARFCFEAPQPPPEPPDGDWPLVLLTGRDGASRWHTQTRTDRSPVLRKLHDPEPFVEIHADDAARLGVGDGEHVRVRSRRGAMLARARVGKRTRPGEVFVPMHFPETNRLTHPSFDPYSRQPAYKHCAVRIERAGVG